MAVISMSGLGRLDLVCEILDGCDMQLLPARAVTLLYVATV